MEPVRRKVLEMVLAGTIEPVVIVRVDQPDWPVALANPAFESLGSSGPFPGDNGIQFEAIDNDPNQRPRSPEPQT